jgi:hypothetical protein
MAGLEENCIRISENIPRLLSTQKNSSNAKLDFCNDNPEKTKACDSMRDTGNSYLVGRAGFEPAKAHANGFTAHPL